MVRNVFTFIALVSLILNLVIDARQYRHMKLARGTSQWANKSRQLLDVVDHMIITAVSDESENEGPALTEQLNTLRGLTEQNQVLDARINELESVLKQPLNLPTQNIAAVKILNQIRLQQENQLRSRLRLMRAQDTLADNWVLDGNLLDVLLVLLLIFFFWYEWLSNRRTQRYLTQSMERLNVVNEALRAREQNKTSVLKTTVHDLKNPLGSIRGFAELIHHEANSRSVVEMSEVIQRISNSTLNLVNTLLREGAPTEGPLPAAQEVDLRQLVEEVCQFLKPMAAAKNQRIDFKGPTSHTDCAILGRTQSLQDAFYNVIGNALKFSPAGSKVRVDCVRRAEVIEITVRDQGPGFKAEDLEKIFRPGQVLSAKPTGNETSSGIGLFSAKRAIDADQGNIQVTNNPGAGACFRVRLPACRPQIPIHTRRPDPEASI